MGRIAIGCCRLAAVFAGAVTHAQPSASAEQQVLATNDQRMDAMRRGDPRPLERVYADDYTLVTSLGEVKTKGRTDRPGEEWRSGGEHPPRRAEGPHVR